MDLKKKVPKHRSRKDVSLFKAINSQSVSTSKDILQLLKEKVLDEASSSWYQSELLYLVLINKKRSNAMENNSQIGSSPMAAKSVSQSSGSDSRQARYLVIVKKTDIQTNLPIVSLLRAFRKDQEVEIKQSYSIDKLKSIDYGSEDQELILSFEQADYSFYFQGQLDRDETLWIISQVFKGVTGNDLTIGYSVDIDALSYMMTTSGAVSRFPALQKLISLNTAHVGDRFSADEAEAEHILDQLQWSKSLSEQLNIHQILSVSSEKLNNETIDFLLQWEEMDELSSLKNNNKNSSLAGKVFGLKDTKEVLVALGEVDGQLETVDRWLGEQIEHLSEIQADLHMIEDESGALETSWQNLNVVQEIVSLLVMKYSLDEQQELLLQYPERSLGPLLKIQSLAQIDRNLTGLINAGMVLKEAVTLKTSEMFSLTNAQWRQIQGITAITAQKKKLMELSEVFCGKMGDFFLTLFDWLLKHKSLVEGGEATANGSNRYPSLFPKSFTSTKAAVESVMGMKHEGFMSNPAHANKFRLPRSRYRTYAHNQLVESQALYHHQVSKFQSLLDVLVELQPSYSRAICEAYLRATNDKLYSPLLKAFIKDLQSMITFKQVSPLSLSSCARYKGDSASNLIVRYDSTTSSNSNSNSNKSASANKVLTSWRLLEIALLLVMPMIDGEEEFIKKTFHLDGRRPEGSNQTALNDQHADHPSTINLMIDLKTFSHSRLHSLLVGLFDMVTPRLLSLSHSAVGAGVGEVDGIEAIAMLTILHEFFLFYTDINSRSSIIGTSPSNFGDSGRKSISAGAEEGKGEGEGSGGVVQQQIPYFYSTLLFDEMKKQLEKKIHSFTTEQINWIIAQKADPKAAGVLPPFYRFPTLVLHVVEMTHDQRFDSVEECLHKIAKELFLWLASVATSSDKYADKIKITNFTFFISTLSTLSLPTLRNFVVNASQQLRESTSRYLHWMVEYEFPSLSALSARIEGVSSKVSDEELSLYIRRKDVLNVLKELENRSVESMVVNIRKRVEKHFRSEFDMELRLVDNIWKQLRERVVGIFSKLETAAKVSYQISIDIGAREVAQAFDKQQLSNPL